MFRFCFLNCRHRFKYVLSTLLESTLSPLKLHPRKRRVRDAAAPEGWRCPPNAFLDGLHRRGSAAPLWKHPWVGSLLTLLQMTLPADPGNAYV